MNDNAKDFKIIFRVAAIIFIVIIIVAIIMLLRISRSRNNEMYQQEELINAILLPDTIERISVKSALGDSGGSSGNLTKRTGMIIRTELYEDGINNFFQDWVEEQKTNEERDVVLLNIRPVINYRVNIGREVVTVEELKGVSNYEGYYLVEISSMSPHEGFRVLVSLIAPAVIVCSVVIGIIMLSLSFSMMTIEERE